ncbi:hypothetical protein [Bradyrhizobium sp. NAS96.2]|uniref:hypothetical protein n=1 Tax=Bradyrhizobium sp. NAS96.2 TaxID=1680160 RepID=UPI000938C087|nr:hypothetical protein [Bradyrhizobium sp. NAS96.2]OKO75590.1 hypothetical protein AC628_19915 [Bradyrhizobium sp. NAS96.2]
MAVELRAIDAQPTQRGWRERPEAGQRQFDHRIAQWEVRSLATQQGDIVMTTTFVRKALLGEFGLDQYVEALTLASKFEAIFRPNLRAYHSYPRPERAARGCKLKTCSRFA